MKTPNQEPTQDESSGTGMREIEISDEVKSSDLLIQRLNQGDDTAIEELFISFEPYLRMVVRRRLQSGFRPKFESMDIVQSVWADLIVDLRESGRQFENQNHLKSFLNRVVMNRFHDRYRKYRREVNQNEPVIDSQLNEYPADDIARPSQVVQRDELWKKILDACPEKHHEILRLRRQGLKHQEIAQRLGLHPSSVRRIIYDVAKSMKMRDI